MSSSASWNEAQKILLRARSSSKSQRRRKKNILGDEGEFEKIPYTP
jgi:hypothetical protein